MNKQNNVIILPDDLDMDGIKRVIATNLAALMAASSDLQSQSALARRSRVAQTTIGNYLNPDTYKGAPTLDKLVRLSRAFRLPAWALLFPGLDPKNPPVVLTAEQRDEHNTALAVYEQVKKLAVAHPGPDVPVSGADDPYHRALTSTRSRTRRR